MLPNLFHFSRLSAPFRCGCVLGALIFSVSAGCSHVGFHEQKLVPAPTLEMGQQIPQRSGDTEPFAVTNQGQKIEDRLLSRQRTMMLPD